MRKVLLLVVSLLLLVLSTFAQKKEDERLKESYNVLKEILGTPTREYLATFLTKPSVWSSTHR